MHIFWTKWLLELQQAMSVAQGPRIRIVINKMRNKSNLSPLNIRIIVMLFAEIIICHGGIF